MKELTESLRGLVTTGVVEDTLRFWLRCRKITLPVEIVKPLQQTRPKTTNTACTGPERVRMKTGVGNVGKQRGEGKAVAIRGKQQASVVVSSLVSRWTRFTRPLFWVLTQNLSLKFLLPKVGITIPTSVGLLLLEAFQGQEIF